MLLKRLFDFIASAAGLVFLSPILVIIALLIKLDSKGPVFFRQQRVGQFGNLFLIHKFRTMVLDAEQKGMQITVGKDPRITSIGGFIRRYKLDELPQLIDVFRGKMSLVGPRPEVPKYVELYPKSIKSKVLSVKPGITDWASIQYKDENTILAAAEDSQVAYVEEVLPVKLNYAADYVDTRSFFGDLKIIFATFLAISR